MARALQDILTELNAVYDPQRQSYNQQIQTLDPQLEAEQKGLQATKEDSFQQITNNANRRGLLYSGLPVQEEQKYIGQQFLPAVANLRAKYSSQRFGLQDAIAKITADQYNNAYGIRNKELQVEEEQRQFNERLAAQERAEAANREAAARAARASSGGGGGGGFSFGGGGGGGAPAAPAAPTINDQAYLSVQKFLSQGDQAARSDFKATAESARRGNAMDKLKMQLYYQARPDLFIGGVTAKQSGGISGNAANVRF